MTAPLSPWRIAELRNLRIAELDEALDAYDQLAADFADAQEHRRTYGKGRALDVAKRAVATCMGKFGKVGVGVIEQHIACDVQALVDELTKERDAAVWARKQLGEKYAALTQSLARFTVKDIRNNPEALHRLFASMEIKP
jgi:hypothetical protein